ncbi:CaiB/BaiF CoA transferase family protein [Halomonas sp. HK25]|uniref:CaiB/BaiF CoA transferase family protein n=1 Tax=Halomonas sp. HK25 TaxID=3394321 RepID=UPI0039FD053B
MQPLTGLKVLDFSTLLPGPLATLLLGEAGAEVIKVERPGRGDEMRSYTPKFGQDSVNFALLNRGKRSLALDLKNPEERERLRPLLEEADILVEQFRPGVMQRLGLGYDELKAINPGLIYCSLTGYGQTGPRAAAAGHDLNYIAETGLLGLSAGADGAPVLPPALIADIGGGAYPAVMNILMTLQQRNRTGKGAYLDVAMADGMFTFMYWALGNAGADGNWPQSGGELVTGGTPRYQIYRTADDRFLATAPLEQKFWDAFCELIELPAQYRADAGQEEAVKQAVAERIQAQPAVYWQEQFAGYDVCCSIVASLQEALQDPQFCARGITDSQVDDGAGHVLNALPLPLVRTFRGEKVRVGYPALGADNDLVDSDKSDKGAQ